MSKYQNKTPEIVRRDCLINGTTMNNYPTGGKERPLTEDELFEWDREAERLAMLRTEAALQAAARLLATGSYEIDARKKA